MRRKTNIKTKSVWERLHKIHNFHHFCVFDMADNPISDSEHSENSSEDMDMILDSDASCSSIGSDEEST